MSYRTELPKSFPHGIQVHGLDAAEDLIPAMLLCGTSFAVTTDTAKPSYVNVWMSCASRQAVLARCGPKYRASMTALAGVGSDDNRRCTCDEAATTETA